MNAVEAAKQLFLRSGADWVLWLLVGLSLASLAVVIERWFYYRAQGGDLRGLADQLDGWLRAAQYDKAIEELTRQGSVAAVVAAAGLRLADRGPAAVERAMQSAIALERGRLERWLAYLGTLGNNAPFIGLFGTVIGIVGAFKALGDQARAQVGTAAQAAQALAPAEVMGAISEALVATAVGIAVAIPAVAANNYFQRATKRVLANTEALSKVLLAYMKSTRPALAGLGATVVDEPERPAKKVRKRDEEA